MVSLLLVSEPIKQVLEAANIDNVFIYTSTEELALQLANKKDSEVIVYGRYLQDALGGKAGAIEFLDIIKKFSRSRIIYFNMDAKKDSVIKYLMGIGEHDIYAINSEDEVTPGFIKDMISRRKTFVDVMEFQDIPSMEKTEYIQVSSLFDALIEFLNKEDYPNIIEALKSSKNRIESVSSAIKRLYESNMELEKQSFVTRIVTKSAAERAEKAENELATALERLDILEKKVLREANELDSLSKEHANLEKDYNEILSRQAKVGPINDFREVNLNRFDTTVKQVIYFKEYSYPKYFNTFMKFLYEVLSKQNKVRFVVYENPCNKIGLKRYEDFTILAGGMLNDTINLDGKDKIVLTEPRRELTEQILSNKDAYDAIIILDRTQDEKFIVTGSVVLNFSVGRSRKDLSRYKAPIEYSITNDTDDAAVNLAYSSKYASVSNEAIKCKLYKIEFISKFLEAVVNYGNM